MAQIHSPMCYSTPARHDPDDGVVVFDHGHFDLDHFEQDQEPSGWLHCRVPRIELLPHVLLWSKDSTLQSLVVPYYVCGQPVLQLAVPRVRCVYCGATNMGRTEGRCRSRRLHNNSTASDRTCGSNW